MFREGLFKAFFDWLNANKDKLEKWYEGLYKEAKDAEAICDSVMKIMGTSMWMFNMMTNCGVAAGVGPNQVNLQDLGGLDEKTTKKVLNLIAACISLQGLPKDIIDQQIPIISFKRFSLKLYIQQQGEHGE
jgi:hypothetical protein